ncbi:MAG: hypothetical protein JXX28_12630 [Deltaproteobacteria bacterium]|nr:hypothetical protein [Deltaproteobacteria bacterium]
MSIQDAAEPVWRRRPAPLLGFSLGSLFGVVILLIGWDGALLVFGLGLLGTLMGLAYESLSALDLDYRQALRVLMRKQ